MKKNYLFLIVVFLLFNLTLKAQSFTYVIDSLLQHLDKSAITTGILYDRAWPAAAVHLLNVNEADTASRSYFMEAYFELLSAAYNQATWAPVDTIANRAIICKQQYNNVPVGLAFYSYNIIDTNALANNLIQMHSDSLYYDTPNRSASPYNLKTTFVASPLLDSVNAQNVLQFVFQSNLFINKSGLTMSSLQVDFADGLGLVSVGLNTSHNVQYYCCLILRQAIIHGTWSKIASQPRLLHTV